MITKAIFIAAYVFVVGGVISLLVAVMIHGLTMGIKFFGKKDTGLKNV